MAVFSHVTDLKIQGEIEDLVLSFTVRFNLHRSPEEVQFLASEEGVATKKKEVLNFLTSQARVQILNLQQETKKKAEKLADKITKDILAFYSPPDEDEG